ncbi:UNVERIFIED_ORG: hypothetical protein M2348_001103 [Sphingomonas sp. R1F5B]
MPIDANTILDQAKARGLAPQMVDFPEGPAAIVEASSLTVMTGADEDGTFVGIVSVGDYDGHRLGTISPLAPGHARAFAASLIAAANQIDGGQRN